MSGVYYVNFDAEKGHCPTSFTKDERSFMQNSSTIQLLKTKYTEFNQNDVVYAKEGELLLFPSHTTHGYKENQGDNRVTISMNIMPTVVMNAAVELRKLKKKPDNASIFSVIIETNSAEFLFLKSKTPRRPFTFGSAPTYGQASGVFLQRSRNRNY